MSTKSVNSDPGQSPKAERLATYLRNELEQSSGEIYVKSKFIANDVGLSSKEIGAMFVQLQDTLPDMTIEAWSYTSATTWRIARST